MDNRVISRIYLKIQLRWGLPLKKEKKNQISHHVVLTDSDAAIRKKEIKNLVIMEVYQTNKK